MSQAVRVRFAPSPTGPLHIGGVRTALYNYLFARQLKGTFILRIEDTDRTRYVPGAEEYILNTLEWLGLTPDESVKAGGEYGPYRQSERKALYKEYAQYLIDNEKAYYAFDTEEELAEARDADPMFKYNFLVREKMNTSLTLTEAEVQQRLDDGVPYVIRIKIPRDEIIAFDDLVRGIVRFHSDELDDKVMLKGDGMPTYHLANIVDDHFMKISHVVRGEEWLPSTPLHVVLYRAFGWEDTMPKFAHLPLILKPSPESYINKRTIQPLTDKLFEEFVAKNDIEAGYHKTAKDFVRQALQDKNGIAAKLKERKKDKSAKLLLKAFLKSSMFGKLSKRDGDRLGFPVFPLGWNNPISDDNFRGFNDFGILPDALLNFLVFLGWNPGTEQEMFTLDELVELFDFKRVSKGGARFNYDKCRWFNQQYIMAMPAERLTNIINEVIKENGHHATEKQLGLLAQMFRERTESIHDFWDNSHYLFEGVQSYDEKTARKRWKSERLPLFQQLNQDLAAVESFDAATLEPLVKQFIVTNELTFGDVLPILRLGVSGLTKGPSVFEIMEFLGTTETLQRLEKAYQYFETL